MLLVIGLPWRVSRSQPIVPSGGGAPGRGPAGPGGGPGGGRSLMRATYGVLGRPRGRSNIVGQPPPG